jgi:hypothetical protein
MVSITTPNYGRKGERQVRVQGLLHMQKRSLKYIAVYTKTQVYGLTN